jgi:hypothetical protein
MEFQCSYDLHSSLDKYVEHYVYEFPCRQWCVKRDIRKFILSYVSLICAFKVCMFGGGVGGKGGGGGRGEKWTKPCMHIWIIKEKWKK